MERKDNTLSHLQRSGPSTEMIDEDLLRKYTRPIIEKWFVANSSSIYLSALQRMRKAFNFSAITPQKEKTNYDYISAAEYDRSTDELRTESRKTLSRPLMTAVCLASRHHAISCHQLLLGKTKPAVVSRAVSNFLHIVEELPPQDRSHIQIMLKGGEERTQNVQYILKSRLIELAAEQGETLKGVVWCPNFASTSRDVINQFPDSLISAYDNGDCHYLGQSDLLSGSPITLLVYLICVYYNISADRLLLQDFSQIAVDYDGSELTLFQRSLLSAYLNAKPLMQALAIHEAILLKYSSSFAVRAT